MGNLIRIKNRIGDFLYNEIFMLIQVVIATWSFVTDNNDLAFFFFLTVMFFQLIFCKDLIIEMLPFVLLCMCVLKNYKFDIADFVKFIPLGVIDILTLGIHLYIYKPVKFVKGKMFWVITAVAVSLLLGGYGVTTLSEVFSFSNIYYTGMLSIGAVLAYLIMINYIGNDKSDIMRYMSSMMVCIGIFGICMLSTVLIPYLKDGIEYRVQWSNNLATHLLIATPFSFYFASKIKGYGVIFFIIGILQYIICFMTLSRGGMIASVVMLLLSITVTITTTNNYNRFFYILISLILVAYICIFVFTNAEIVEKLTKLLKISPNESRIVMWMHANEMFKRYPLFGRGMGYLGPAYNPVKGAMYWYHSTIYQIIGSLGLVGIIAYSGQFITRFMLIIKGKAEKSMYIFLSLIGFEIMGLVNPGVFVPVPFIYEIIAIFVIAEIVCRKVVCKENLLTNKHFTVKKKF